MLIINMLSYEDKYLKYKIKYVSLIHNLEGGGRKRKRKGKGKGKEKTYYVVRIYHDNNPDLNEFRVVESKVAANKIMESDEFKDAIIDIFSVQKKGHKEITLNRSDLHPDDELQIIEAVVDHT